MWGKNVIPCHNSSFGAKTMYINNIFGDYTVLLKILLLKEIKKASM